MKRGTDVTRAIVHNGWCMESKIPFSDDLLNQLTDAAKNKVCICKACAMGNKAQGTPSN